MEHTEEFDTVVGHDVVLSGSLKNSGSILINGRVIGDVTSNQAVVVGPEAMVEGPITAENVQVAGSVHGSVTTAGTLELLPNSKVKGDIKAGTLHIQPGASFNGTSAMEVEEESEESPKASFRAAPSFDMDDEDEELDELTAPAEEPEDEAEPAEEPKTRRKPKLELE